MGITRQHLAALLLFSASFFMGVQAYHHEYWVAGTAIDANLLTDGGTRPAYQAAHSSVQNPNYGLYLLADGHGAFVPDNNGLHAAQHSLHVLQHELTQELDNDESGVIEPRKLLDKAFTATQKHLAGHCDLDHAGAAVTALFCIDGMIWCAGVGNVRAVLSRGGVAMDLSFDHTPDKPLEHARLLAAGQNVTLFDKPRVCDLPLSRSLGDSALEKVVISSPEINVMPVTEYDEFIILACDGVWSVLSSNEAVQLVREALKNGCDPDEAAQKLVDAAKSGLSGVHSPARDSITVTVVQRAATRGTIAQSTELLGHVCGLLDVRASDWFTSSASLCPLIAGLLQAQRSIGQNQSLSIPMNSAQQGFFDFYMPLGSRHDVLWNYHGFSHFRSHELNAWAANDVDAVNKVLASNGFDITLEKVEGRPSFYIASILDIAVRWKSKALATKIKIGNALHDAVCMNRHFTTYESTGHKHPVFAITTQSDDIVFITKADRARANIELLGYVTDLERTMQLSKIGYDELVFAMVDFCDTAQLRWLEGLQLDSQWHVAQVVQQNRFKMNECGARAQSAAALSAVFRSVRYQKNRSYTVNEPFFCWVSRPGVRQPLFAGYITPEQWKNPGVDADDITAHAQDEPDNPTQQIIE